ncbi:MAG: cytochrome c [Thiogranum sp.]|nr:cytochrome c [Thiogranum sp.]
MRKSAWQTLLRRAALLLCVTMGLPAISLAELFDRGEALYENHCKSCHESWAHEREGREAVSRAAVRKRVAAWSVHSGLDWSDQEIDDVTDYLDRQFYRFGQ